MFRITSAYISARSLLYRRPRPDRESLSISRLVPNLKYKKPKEREPCPLPPPPPPPPPRDDSLFWGTMAFLVLSGSFVAYAKNNPEIRDWITIQAPWFDEFIAFAYQENCTYGEYLRQFIEDTKEALLKYYKDDKKPKQCSADGKPVPVEEAEEAPPEEEEPEKVIDPDAPCEKVPPPILTKDICEIERCLADLAEHAIFNLMTARDSCIVYNEMVEDAMQNFSFKKLKRLRPAMEERVDLVKDSLDNAFCASVKLDELSRYFDCGVQAPKEAIKNTKEMLREYRDRIKTMRMEYEWENDKASVVDCLWQRVEVLVDKYTEENKTMSSGLDYTHKKPQFSGDPDLLLLHTMKYVEMLKTELNEAVSLMKERTNRGVASLPQGEKERKDRKVAIQKLHAQKLAGLDGEFKKRADDRKAANDRRLQKTLKKQLEKTQITLELRLKQKEAEAEAKLEKMVAEQVEIEKKMMEIEMSKLATTLKILEEKLNAHLKAERETRRSQELWSAGSSLLAAMRRGEPIVRVDKELQAIEKASGDEDKLVATVLKAIPDSVREHGVVPESVLRDKYRVMEDTALKVALVEQEGGPLPIYVISFIQSLFLFMKISGIPQKEFDKPPKEPSKDLDTFDLLQRARFWIDRGDLAKAIEYVGALQGASRTAAASWHDAARSHLETRQAAEAVLAHAAALGLQYV